VKKYLLPLLFTVSFIFAACSKNNGKDASSINIILEKKPVTAESLNLQSFLNILTSTPTSTNDFNCFTVNITGAGIIPRPEGLGPNCQSSDNMGGRGFGVLSPAFTKGNSITIPVPLGSGRNFDVYGIYPSIPECTGTQTAGGSAGYFLGNAVADTQNDTSVTIPINYAANTSGTLTCNSGSSFNEFGDGSWGNFTITTTSDASTTTVGGRYINAYRNVTNIGGAGDTLGLGSAVGTDFQVGDMVIFLVTGEGAATGCSSNPTELKAGMMTSATLTAASGSTVTLDHPITNAVGSVNNGNLVSAPNSANFCKIQIVRVAQFNNLTMSNASVAGLNTINYNYANGTGGVIAIKINGTLTISGGGSITIGAAGNGFAGGVTATTGDGISGQAIGSSHGGNGGSGTLGGGGGAGVASTGGDGGYVAAPPGAGGTNPCGAGQCFYFGSGGGGGGAAAGGNGGGIVLVWARNIVVVGGTSFVVSARGAFGVAGGAQGAGGGGGGGSVFLVSQSQSGGVNIHVDGEYGGTAMAGGGGGGGGGGRGIYRSCNGGSVGPANTGGAAGTGGANGVAGAPGSVSQDFNPGLYFCGG